MLQLPACRVAAFAAAISIFSAQTGPVLAAMASGFAKKAAFSAPNLSPDGQHLAVIALTSENGESKYQLDIFHVPDLTFVSRLDVGPRYIPTDVNWISDRRLVVGIGKENAFSEPPRATGDILAVDFDGRNKRTLVSATGISANPLKLPRGIASISGYPSPASGHFYLTIDPTPGTLGAGSRRTLLYDVDAIHANAREIASIDKVGYRFLVHDGIARYAFGSDDKLQEHLYYRPSANEEWSEINPNIAGKHLAPLFISYDGAKLFSLGNISGGPNEFAMSNLDGSQREVLAANPKADISAVYRSPKPRAPYAAITDDGKPKIIYLDNSKYAKALLLLSNQYADHFVTFSDLSEGGDTAIIYAVSDRDPGTYSLYDFQKNTLRPLFQSMPWLNSEQLGERRPFWFTTTTGIEMNGFLNFPPSGTRKNLPTILMPHSGPTKRSNAWAMSGWEEKEAQFLATEGYLVVQVNYRGSGGRGQNFLDLGRLQIGQGMLQDQLDALNWAIVNGYADKKRVCAYGAAYGGYAAYQLPIYAPAKTFRCSIVFAGISDIRLQNAQNKYDAKAFGEIWGMNDASFVRNNSPINNIDKFEVPVLIIHGKNDPIVPVQNALQMMDALTAKGRPFQSLIQTEEGHGFLNEESNAARYEAIVDFLQRYLRKNDLR